MAEREVAADRMVQDVRRVSELKSLATEQQLFEVVARRGFRH